MKIIVMIGLFALGFLFFTLTAHASDWQELKPGVHFKIIQTKYQENLVHVHVLKIDPSLIQIKPVYADQKLLAKKHAEKSGALAVINANFFDTEGKVLGLVKRDGKDFNGIKNISWWSVFCTKDSQSKIVHTTQYRETMCDQAVQAGPRLVVEGAIPQLKDELSRKTAVGINGKGELFLIVTREQIPIKEFAILVSSSESDGGLGCPNAINLDGGSSSQLYITGADDSFNVPSFIEFPAGLGVFDK